MDKRNCLFCGGSPLTREHIFPKWLTTFFETETPGAYFATDVISSKGVSIGSWETSGVNDTVKVVCENCNKGWMSNLEASAKPILSNMFRGTNPLSFDQTESNILARWAYKTAIIIDKFNPQVNVNPCRTIPEFVYKRFYESGFKIPSSVRIWTIPMADPQRGIWQRRSDLKISVKLPDKIDRNEILQASCHLTTFGILHSVFQVLGPFDSKSPIFEEPPAHLLQLFPQITDKAIWPNDGKSFLLWEDRDWFVERKDLFG